MNSNSLSNSPKNTDEPAGPEVIITGNVLSQGVARGKTIAAWNGVPSGKQYLVFKLEDPKTHPTHSRDPIEVWSSHGFPDAPNLIGKSLTLVGKWKIPPKDNLSEMRQRPIGPALELTEFPTLEELEAEPKSQTQTPNSSDELLIGGLTAIEDRQRPVEVTVDGYVPISPKPVFWVKSFSVIE